MEIEREKGEERYVPRDKASDRPAARLGSDDPMEPPRERPGGDRRFRQALATRGCGPLRREETGTLQVNVGKICNQACHHCHVDASPRRSESMSAEVADRVLQLLNASPGVQIVDITGGAPELNPNFRRLIAEARRLGRHAVDRCNLTVLLEPGMGDLAGFLAANRVEVIASLPCYLEENVDRQRGHGVFQKSVEALRLLNGLGYGRPGSGLELNLVYNPVGYSLPPPQQPLESEYKNQLGNRFGIEFNHLFTITNMPIQRFAEDLHKSGKQEEYMALLVNHFNPVTVPHLMCRSLVSVGWNGRLYDCDFNQMLDLGMGASKGAAPMTVWDVESFSGLAGKAIATGSHCFGCTAGSGSSCGGALQ